MIIDNVKEYYGVELQGSNDLKTDACCTDAALPSHIKEALANVHDEVLSHYYGCGLIAPEDLEGCRVLDLGSGSGRDAYVLAQLVGENGEVVGVDMTPAQLNIANRHVDWHREKFGYSKSNVRFIEGQLENLLSLGLELNSFDIIISNCVINLCTDKLGVISAARELLKPGGEMYFSDVYSDRRVPENLQKDPVLYGECLSGALYINDFERISREAGFIDPRVVESRRLGIDNAEIEKKVGHIKFYSVTYRLFKIEMLESLCEEYGQWVKYLGTLKTSLKKFILDDHHSITKGEKFSVCGNTYRMLNETRFAKHFDFHGSFDTHYGIFAGCGGASYAGEADVVDAGGCCSTNSIDSNESSYCAPATAAAESGFVQATKLEEVWFHTGTQCNLSCTGCLEGSGPGVKRIEALSFADAKKLIDETVELGVTQISFTGGEPFVNSDFIKILDYALDRSDCLVLTNGTKPTLKKLDEIKKFLDKSHELHFRISLDSYDIHTHEKVRGEGSFQLALDTLRKLHEAGFKVSIARRSGVGENSSAVVGKYGKLFLENGLPDTLPMVAFPELLAPDSHPGGLPEITNGCLASHGEENKFMCEFSRMVLKKDSEVRVYACTLVDDDEVYDLGTTLAETINTDIHLTHHRCFSCFSQGASCSEL